MADESTDSRDDRLAGIVRAYTDELDAGRHPDRRALLKQHPDLADDLSACLGGLSFVRQAAGMMAADPSDFAPADPQPLGDFRLLREIGRGGMGVVYEADQLSLGRRVAVKVLPMAAAMDERQLQRFRNEASAAAQLHHTNIVPVYAVGCERSIHFYAMQLIDGQSLADVIRDLRAVAADGKTSAPSSTATGPSQGLSSMRSAQRAGFYRTVASLGLQAADALHHAHHAGIVHRDIKPANLLLDGAANVWITDFGLAQFYAEENNLTQSADRPGTLRYMSPEQASGRAVVLDQRTDIYSLGVTLYELLTLERAVAGDTREQLAHNLATGEIRPARSIDANVPKELETILATATAREPADRYATAGALAEDLRRFLADEAILARPPSLAQKSVRWIRRHRTVAASAVVTGLLLLGGFAVSTVLIAREQAKTRDAYLAERDRAVEATRQRLRAERGFAEAREAVDFFTRIAATELNDDRPSPEVRREMLEASVDYYQTFLQEHGDDPDSSRQLTQARTQVSRLLGELTVIEEAYRQRSLVGLLNLRPVADELRLTATQSQRVHAMFDELRAGSSGDGPPGGRPHGDAPGRPGAPTSDAQRERLVRLGGQIAAALGDLLTAAQYERLQQIARQVRGPTAFADPDVTRALSLSTAQKEVVRQTLATYRAARRRGPPPGERGPSGQDGPPDERRPPDAFDRFDDHDPTREQSMRTLVTLLDPSQAAVWQGLVGRPFANAAALAPDPQHRPFDGPGGDSNGPRPPSPDDFGPR